MIFLFVGWINEEGIDQFKGINVTNLIFLLEN
jgi:hypothetical protein